MADHELSQPDRRLLGVVARLAGVDWPRVAPGCCLPGRAGHRTGSRSRPGRRPKCNPPQTKGRAWPGGGAGRRGPRFQAHLGLRPAATANSPGAARIGALSLRFGHGGPAIQRHSCAVVLFLKYSHVYFPGDADGAFHTSVTMGTFYREAERWAAHKWWTGTGWSHDPIADPGSLRDLGGRAIAGGSGGHNPDPMPGFPASVVTGRVSPAVTHLALVQDDHEERRELQSHFGPGWCAPKGGPLSDQRTGRDRRRHGAHHRAALDPSHDAHPPEVGAELQ
jgi:hypothetical protein